jgi:DNA-binding FadR family transcriptional regulator
MRASIGADAARRCAGRADRDTRARVRALARATAAATGPGETDERYAELWRAIVAGSGNLAYRLALNSLNAALEAHQEILELIRPTDPAAIEALGDAIAAADASRAAGAARVLLEP